MTTRSAFRGTLRALLAAAFTLAPAAARGEDAAASDLANKLANPVADLVSLPLQFNYDCCYGSTDGERITLNVQPVVPIKLNDDWNLVLRTIVPFITQTAATPTGGDQMGLGDTTQTFFFSPRNTENGLTWAVGPAFFYPTGTGGFSAQKWAAGPSALILKQQGGMTYGMLTNHLWSFAGNDRSEEISNTLLQPFFNYTFPSSTGVLVNLESTYDWRRKQWSVPMNAGVTHVYKLGEQRIQIGIMGRYHIDSPSGGPDWGVRFVATFLIPS